MNDGNWQIKYQAEIDRAKKARAENNEGMARVCARRAAGHVVKEYFRREGMPLPGKSALQHLKYLKKSGEVPDHIRVTAGRFIQNITPDHILPGDVDLLDEVEKLRHALLEY